MKCWHENCSLLYIMKAKLNKNKLDKQEIYAYTIDMQLNRRIYNRLTNIAYSMQNLSIYKAKYKQLNKKV